MPWTRRQVRYLESSGSPLSAAQKDKMNSELHADPSLGHNKKGSTAMKKGMSSEPMREMRVEVHRGPKKEVTGFTVHHHMMPKATKSAAFMENTTHSHPFSADEHEKMMDHISDHLGAQVGATDAGAVKPKAAPAGASEMEEGEEEGEDE